VHTTTKDVVGLPSLNPLLILHTTSIRHKANHPIMVVEVDGQDNSIPIKGKQLPEEEGVP
jgi:hypothetical protein